MKNAIQLYFEIASCGYEENFKELIQLVRKYGPKFDHVFKDLFEDAAKEYILERIGLSFNSYSLAKLKEDYGIEKDFLVRKGY